MNGYVAGFKNAKLEIMAETLYEAKQKAIASFKPKKSQAHMVWVMLAEKEGEQVSHTFS